MLFFFDYLLLFEFDIKELNQYLKQAKINNQFVYNFDIKKIETRRKFQKKFLNQLNVNSPTQQIKEGAFKGTNIYSWNREFDGLIVTEVFFNKEKPFSKEIFKSITLIRKNDCVHLGSNWQTSNSSNLPFLVKNYEVNFSQVADRKFDKL